MEKRKDHTTKETKKRQLHTCKSLEADLSLLVTLGKVLELVIVE
jgi:hypothetical protein